MDIQRVEQDNDTLVVTFNGKPLVCPVCRGDRFQESNALLNTRSGEFLGMAWMDDKATNFICNECGYIFWFLLD